MSGLGYEFIVFLVIALVIAVVCVLPNSRKKSSNEVNGSKKKINDRIENNKFK